MTAWHRRAACLGMDTNLFFPENGRYEQVLPVCVGCVVRLECLLFAVSVEPDLHGMFGGMTPAERQDWKWKPDGQRPHPPWANQG